MAHSPGADSASQVDALATVVSPKHDDSCVYGESSTIAFLRQLEQTEQDRESSTLTPQKSAADSRNSSKDCEPAALLPLRPSSEADLAVLPLRYRADKFLNCYWDFVHPVFPLLHKHPFAWKYQQIWLPHEKFPQSAEDTVFLCNLNLVLALGCQFCRDIDAHERLTMANQFYERSQRVLLFDILGTTSLPVVQWLLLTAVYCQSTSHASRCWNSIGLAIRLAQSLGLHMEHSTHSVKSQVELEMKRRIWHNCVVLDRFVK